MAASPGARPGGQARARPLADGEKNCFFRPKSELFRRRAGLKRDRPVMAAISASGPHDAEPDVFVAVYAADGAGSPAAALGDALRAI